MSVTGVWFGSSVTPQPNIVASLKFRTKPKSLKLHASSSLFDFPLASKIMVKNLSYSTTETCLRKEFSKFCQIAEVKLVMDEKAKRSKGYAFIQYTSQDDALLALESMDHKYFDGRVIFVELAKPGHNAFGVYSKTTGPPQEQNIANQDEAMEGAGVSLFRFLFGLQSLQQDTCWHGHLAKTHMCDVKKNFKEWLSPEDLEVVLTIPIAAVHRDDLLIWHHNPSGVYSVKSGYALAKQICHNSNGPSKPSGSLILGTDFWNSIWALDIPPKIRHFWWRVCHNLLATKLGLFRRKCAASGECPICRKDDESVEHLLFECPWTKVVWFGSSLNMLANPGSIANVTRWTNDLLQGGNSKIESKRIISSAATIAWFIWKSRNDFVFNHQVVDPHVTLQKITHFWQEHDALIGSFNPHNQASTVPNRPSHLGWQSPSHTSVKFNCDAAFCQSSSSAALAAIL